MSKMQFQVIFYMSDVQLSLKSEDQKGPTVVFDTGSIWTMFLKEKKKKNRKVDVKEQ